MAKLTTYLLMIFGTLIVCYIGGVMPETSTIGMLMNVSNLSASAIFVKALWIVGSLIAAAGISTFVGKDARFIELLYYGFIIYILFNFAFDIIGIYTYNFGTFGELGKIIGVLLLSPLILVYFLTVLEWYRGMTT
jgi:hypothetical protein